jgi:hypothetical protein
LRRILWDAPATGTPLTFLAVCRATSGGSLGLLAGYAGQFNLYINRDAATYQADQLGGQNSVQWSAPAVDATVSLAAYTDGVPTATTEIFIEVNGGSPVDQIANETTGGIPASGTFDMGAVSGVFFFFAGEVVEFLVVSGKPSPAQFAAYATYKIETYG